MRPGVRLGLDPGDARIGVAVSDPTGFLATPVQNVQRGPGDIRVIGKLVREYDAMEIVVGLPRSLSGDEGPAAKKVRRFARALARRVAPVSVRLVDERMTTVVAEQILREQGRSGAKRREVVDQAAAVLILQHALDTERSTQIAPGVAVAPDPEDD